METNIDKLKHKYIDSSLLDTLETLRLFEHSGIPTLVDISKTINEKIQEILEPIRVQNEAINKVTAKINKVALNTHEALILYYMYDLSEHKPNMKDEDEICQWIDNHSSKFTLSLEELQKLKSNNNNKDCKLDNIYLLLENEYKIEHTEIELSNLFKEINTYENIIEWINIYESTNGSNESIKIIVLNSMIQPLSDILHIPYVTKDMNMRCKVTDWKQEYNMYSTEAAEGIIAINVLFSNYTDKTMTFVPNRNILAHKGITYYKGTYEKTYCMLVDLMYKMLNFRLQQYKFDHASNKT